jgi:hypothetical protein
MLGSNWTAWTCQRQYGVMGAEHCHFISDFSCGHLFVIRFLEPPTGTDGKFFTRRWVISLFEKKSFKQSPRAEGVGKLFSVEAC